MPGPQQRARDVEVALAFGARVREVRNAQGLTQEALAEAAELHPTFISNVERGYRVPTVPTMLRLARGLGVDASALVDDLAVEETGRRHLRAADSTSAKTPKPVAGRPTRRRGSARPEG